MEYCNWMASVTPGHMVFRSPLATGLSPLSESFDIDCSLTQKLPARNVPGGVGGSPPPLMLRGLNCLSWKPWFPSHGRQYSHTNFVSFFFQYHWSGENWLFHVVHSQHQWF